MKEMLICQSDRLGLALYLFIPYCASHHVSLSASPCPVSYEDYSHLQINTGSESGEGHNTPPHPLFTRVHLATRALLPSLTGPVEGDISRTAALSPCLDGGQRGLRADYGSTFTRNARGFTDPLRPCGHRKGLTCASQKL